MDEEKEAEQVIVELYDFDRDFENSNERYNFFKNKIKAVLKSSYEKGLEDAANTAEGCDVLLSPVPKNQLEFDRVVDSTRFGIAKSIRSLKEGK